MARWPWLVTLRVRALAKEGRVRFTSKALAEIEALGLAINGDDAVEVLAALTPRDAAERIRSSVSGDWLYVFRPLLAGERLYVKLRLHQHCVVISFHTEEYEDEEAGPA